MRAVTSLVWLAALGTAAFVAGGCGQRKPTPAKVVEELQQSFKTAEAPVRQEVSQVTAAVQSGDYAQAVAAMNRIAQAQPVNEAQKKAVNSLIYQTRQAAQQNPKLNSPEMYKALSDLTLRVHGEN